MRVSSPPLAVIFDTDGLIFDTQALYQRSVLQLTQEQGIDTINISIIQETIGLSWTGTREFLDNLLADTLDADELIENWIARYDMLAEQNLNLKPGVRELLAVLEEKAIPRAIATGSYRAVALRHLLVHTLSNLRARVPCARLALGRTMLARHLAGTALAVAVR